MTALIRQNSAQQFQKRVEQSDKKCICQICSCGKHHCPPRHIQFKAETTNHEMYKPYNVAVQKHHKCAYTVNQNHYDPDLLKSTYRVNYKQYQCEPHHQQSRYAYQPNNNKFIDQTEYKKSYVPHQIAAECPVHCSSNYRPNTAKFDGKTTYDCEFKAKRVEQVQPKQHYAYQQNKLPFFGQTTYGDNFKKYEIAVDRPQTCCQGSYKKSTAKFEGKSSYKDNFQGRQGERGSRCLIEQLPPRPRECSPGKDHVHFCSHQCRWE